MNRTVYIAGQITGVPKEQAAEKFNTMAARLAGMGYNVVKPDALYEDPAMWSATARADIKKMLECDEVHLLPGWQQCRGAQLKRDIALRLGMELVYH